MNVVHLKEISHIKIKKTLGLFIKEMKDKAKNYTDISWDSDIWILNKKSMKFTKISENRYHNEKMNSEFIEFAKAYVIHEHPFRTSKGEYLIAALRCIEYALYKNNCSGNICEVNYAILGEIITFIRGRYSNNYSYGIGRQMEKIALFLYSSQLTYMNIGGWNNPIKFKQDYYISNKEKHKEKLPKDEILYIFADIFSKDLTDKRDIFTTSVVALLMSAPSRISEVLSLSVDCIFKNKTKTGEQKLGLRFWAGKGYGGDIKWIPSLMAPVTQKAIERLIIITKPTRAYAKLMELDFKTFHKKCIFSHYPRNKSLTILEVCKILWKKKVSKNEGGKFLKRLSLKNYDYAYTIETLWIELQNRLPEGFPWYNKKRNIKFSDLLFLFFKDSLHLRKSDNLIQFYKPNTNSFYSDVYCQDRRKNIFQRYDYQYGDKREFHFHTHQVRHLLNTIAQKNGMSEYELAKWSGRASIKQNRVYNHVNDEEILEQYESLKLKATNYSITESIKIRDPVSRESLLSIHHSAIHKTEFGYCVHDYALSPCEKFRDCLNCSEQICIKGEGNNLMRLKKRLLDTNELIEVTIKKSNNNDCQKDKDRWLNFHIKTKERLQELIAILENKDISDGSFVRLTNNSYSHLTRVINSMGLLDNKIGDDNVKKIN
ncbi:hypothetical protein E2S48_20245 [Salmonella enterica]|nr:hypothetical protein [Salmonella enterica]EDX2062962.1 hypothetical protein [Salmonella enterica subsp. enterica serovar Javiana]EAR8972530.1 hypothetical protein [Salmonella enterica]EAT8218873.1 hypothetical protein [Salmonella enterica]EHG4835717.1 hypothetical protein [Salmonella enterica]